MRKLRQGRGKYWLALLVILLVVGVYIAQAIIPEPPAPITADGLLDASTLSAESVALPDDYSASFAPDVAESYALFRVRYWAVVEQTATGRSTDISGTVTVTTGSEATISGEIQVDLRPLDAGSDQINAVMHDDVLLTDTYPYALLTPDTLEGLPATLTTNTVYPVTIIGELTLRERTFPVRFDARLTLTSEDGVVISGVAEISRTLFELNAPQPFGSSLADTVTLAFRFAGLRVIGVDAP